MIRKARVYVKNIFAGILMETEDGGFSFTYDSDYLQKKDAKAVSLTLPLRKEPYVSQRLFSFFEGLIPEGWLLDVVIKNWKVMKNDRMGLLLTCCRECVGAVHVESDE